MSAIAGVEVGIIALALAEAAELVARGDQDGATARIRAVWPADSLIRTTDVADVVVTGMTVARAASAGDAMLSTAARVMAKGGGKP